MDHAFEVKDTNQFVLLKEDAKVLKKKTTYVFCKKTGHSESQCYKKKPHAFIDVFEREWE